LFIVETVVARFSLLFNNKVNKEEVYLYFSLFIPFLLSVSLSPYRACGVVGRSPTEVKKLIIAITGTPGTGKTSVCKAHGLECLDLNIVIENQGFYTGVDPRRGCLIADLDKLQEYMRHKEEQKLLIIEGHLAHFMNPDVAIVLRANPAVLTERLKQKGFPAQKIKENVEAETLDVILVEAVELCEIVHEVDTSGKSVEEVAAVVQEIIDAETEAEIEEEGGSGSGIRRKKALRARYKPGYVDWTRYLMATLKNPKSQAPNPK
jgi:adenylate kinase